MAKKEPPQEYIEVLEVLNVLYDEVDGCSFYDYIFPDNQKVNELQAANLQHGMQEQLEAEQEKLNHVEDIKGTLYHHLRWQSCLSL